MDTDLYTAGWRQGSILRHRLESTYLSVNDGAVVPVHQSTDLWVVCTQDCDLRGASAVSDQDLIEIRPVHEADGPADWGIRSRRLRLYGDWYIDAESPRTLVTPALLTAFEPGRLDAVPPHRRRALKTWLGLRYDRPAVPDHLVELAKDVAKRCSSRSGRVTAQAIHDVLMQFDESTSPPGFTLFAVVTDDADRRAIREWLGEAALRVPATLGVLVAYDVGTRDETSLALLEESYSADVSQVTWGGELPTGAE